MTGITTLLPVFVDPTEATVDGLLRAIESVLSQECRVPHELLIVDDGSSPDLASLPELQTLLVNSNVRSNVRLLRLGRNRGVTYALNAGLTQARYDWIARIDADDFWRPGKLLAQLKALDGDPELTLIATSMRLRYPSDSSRDRDDVRGGAWEQMPLLVERHACPIPHGSILARKDVFAALGGYPHDPRFQHCEDFALWAVWMRFFNLAVLDDVLFEWTYSDSQISSRFAAQQWQGTTVVLKTLSDLGDCSRIPGAIREISRAWGLSLLDTSKLLHDAWRFFDQIFVQPNLLDAARIVLPDRSVHDTSHLSDPPPSGVCILKPNCNPHPAA